jgi:ATP phosphoribosyltransferase regulatory subunit
MPSGEARSEARRLRAEGWNVLAGLAPEADAVAEARRLRCSHVFRDGRPSPLD